jgi:hypothetical protein
MRMGYAAADYAGKPVIAIVNTWSGATSAARFRERRSTMSSAACYGRADFRSGCRRSAWRKSMVRARDDAISHSWR